MNEGFRKIVEGFVDLLNNGDELLLAVLAVLVIILLIAGSDGRGLRRRVEDGNRPQSDRLRSSHDDKSPDRSMSGESNGSMQAGSELPRRRQSRQ